MGTMMTRSEEPTGSPALAALIRLGRDGVKQPSRAELDQGLNALYNRIAAGRVRRRATTRWSLIGAAALLSSVVALLVISLSRQGAPTPTPPALAYRLEGGELLEGGYLRESGHAGIRLLFSEGSRLDFTPGTRGRLRNVDATGARVAIEQGTASFRVTPSADRRWWVEVGPFLVTVTGTVFTVDWDPSGERFELRLREGRVLVSGPVSGGDLALRSGQRLVVDLTRAETVITEDGAESALAPFAAAPTASGSSLAVDTAMGSSPSAVPAPSSLGQGQRGWTSELTSGQWNRILERVDRDGVEATLNSASSEDLFALADAARYRRRPDLARSALLAQRRRFPDSPRALDAIFLLGRAEESRGGGAAPAIARYDEYLARAPAGPYAAEALGRKMTIASQVGGPALARPLAEEYLRRFPKGSYAGAARALLRVP